MAPRARRVGGRPSATHGDPGGVGSLGVRARHHRRDDHGLTRLRLLRPPSTTTRSRTPPPARPRSPSGCVRSSAHRRRCATTISLSLGTRSPPVPAGRAEARYGSTARWWPCGGPTTLTDARRPCPAARARHVDARAASNGGSDQLVERRHVTHLNVRTSRRRDTSMRCRSEVDFRPARRLRLCGAGHKSARRFPRKSDIPRTFQQRQGPLYVAAALLSRGPPPAWTCPR